MRGVKIRGGFARRTSAGCAGRCLYNVVNSDLLLSNQTTKAFSTSLTASALHDKRKGYIVRDEDEKKGGHNSHENPHKFGPSRSISSSTSSSPSQPRPERPKFKEKNLRAFLPPRKLSGANDTPHSSQSFASSFLRAEQESGSIRSSGQSSSWPPSGKSKPKQKHKHKTLPESRIASNVGSLISHSANPPPGWVYSSKPSPPGLHSSSSLSSPSSPTPTRSVPDPNGSKRKEYKSLAGNIPSVVNKRGESLEKMAFERRLVEVGSDHGSSQRGGGAIREEEDGDGDGGFSTTGMLLEPGSFVELRRATTCINAILLSSSYASRMLIYSSLSNTGEVFVHQQDDVYFDAPGFVAKDVIARCGGGEGEDVPDIAENKTQLQARVEILKKLREVQREVENATNVLLSRQGTESLDVYALTSEERNWGETTVWEVAKLLGPLNRNHTGQLNSSDPSLSSTDTTDTNLPASAPSSSPIRTPSFYQILAAHKYLLANPLYFVPAHDYGTSRRVRVRPREDVRRMTEIDGWVRERGRIREGEEENPNPLERFIEKARLVIENQKSKTGERINMLHSPPTRDTSKAGSALTWTTSEQSIITFLVQSLRTLNRAQADAFLIGVQYIVKKVYRDVDDVTDEVVHRLLIEIGAFPPWQDLTEIKAIVEQELYLDTTGDKENGFSRKQEEVLDQVQHSESLPYQTQPNGPLGPDDFYPSDLAASFRHDFEEMPVYVIDDTDAKELDDGISVEAVEQNPDQVWIHVHIADPTSLLPPTHALAKEAEKMTESMYLVHRSYPMLPRAFTHHPTLGFSLGCMTTATSGQPTLTFSARISLDNAEILEYKVRAGMVKNLIICSYDEVDRALGFGNRIWNKPFSLADVSSPSTPSSGTLENPQHKTSLTLLYKATQSLVRKRVEDGVFIQSRPVSKLAGIRWPSTSDSGIVGFPIKPEQPVYEYKGYPFFASFSPQANSNTPSQSDLLSYLNQYATTAQHTLDGHSHSLVAECMKLASRACSMFCRDRDVPILRRWAGPPLISGEQGLADLLNARNKDGYLVWGSENDNNTASPNGWKLAGAHILGDSAAGYTLDLRAHWGLGIPEAEGYVRCTSPLRRYADLVVHWQIKSVLIDEENNKRAGLPATKPKYLYPTSYLSSFATSNKAAERFRRRIAGQHEAWWSIAWLIRWAEAYQSWTSGEGLGAWYEFTPTAMTASTRPNLSESSSRNLQGLPNPFAHLTATLSARPEANRDSKKWQAAVTLTGLGIKAVLIEGGGSGGGYHISELSVGDTVPVRVNAMRLGVRPQVQVVPRTD